jgi:long-chain acyl-CoA synthetase
VHGLSREELVKDRQVNALIAEEVQRCNQHFGRYSQIKKFALLPREWTTATGELTPTLKIRRKITLEKYAVDVEALYSSEEPGKASVGTPAVQTAKARSSIH